MKEEKNDQKERPMKAYTSPSLILYGSIKEMTKGGSGTAAENSQTGVKRP